MKKKALALGLVVGMALSATTALAADKLLFDDFNGSRTKDPSPNSEGRECYWVNNGGMYGSEITFDGSAVTIKYTLGGPNDMSLDAPGWAKAKYGVNWAYGNWGEAYAIDCDNSEGKQQKLGQETTYYKYLNIKIKGAKGGEEKYIILDLSPQDETAYSMYFEDLTLKGGGHPKITTSYQNFTIDLKASKMPGISDRFHIRSALAGVEISVDEISFEEIDHVGAPNPTKATYYPDLEIKNINADGTPKASEEPAETTVAGNNNTASATPSSTPSPKTGDSTLILLAGIVLMLSVGAVTVLKVRKTA